jgi:hypothetical protein
MQTFHLARQGEPRCFRLLAIIMRYATEAWTSLMEGTMNGSEPTEQCVWARLEEHFSYHASLVARFRAADSRAVLGMVRTGQNEQGQTLSAFEREALVERHCEIFGCWPT